jgi:hypothetical protein
MINNGIELNTKRNRKAPKRYSDTLENIRVKDLKNKQKAELINSVYSGVVDCHTNFSNLHTKKDD